MHLKQPGFIYSTCEPFTKNKERIQKSKETGNLRYIYQDKPRALSMIWFMKISKIYLEEHLLIKFYMTKHSIMQKKTFLKNSKYEEK